MIAEHSPSGGPDLDPEEFPGNDGADTPCPDYPQVLISNQGDKWQDLDNNLGPDPHDPINN